MQSSTTSTITDELPDGITPAAVAPSREEAMAEGLSYYREPCKHGHEIRSTKTKACRQCNREAQRAWRERDVGTAELGDFHQPSPSKAVLAILEACAIYSIRTTFRDRHRDLPYQGYTTPEARLFGLEGRDDPESGLPRRWKVSRAGEWVEIPRDIPAAATA